MTQITPKVPVPCQHVFTSVSFQTQSGEPVPIYEIMHLRGALDRLERIGETKSPAIANLKHIVQLRIAELEAVLDSRPRARA